MAYEISKTGICIPKDDSTLAVFKNIQKELNRFLDAEKKTLLTCDGKLGKQTLAALNGVVSKFPIIKMIAGGNVTSCATIADNPSAFYNGLQHLANESKLAVVACPGGIIRKILSPEPTVSPSGVVSYDAGGGGCNIAGIPCWYIALAAAGGGYYYFYKTEGGKKKRKSLFGGR
jgi:hypothetical protein